MRKRTERLFDCLTDLDAHTVEEALDFVPKRHRIRWAQVAALAAALLLVFRIHVPLMQADNKSGSANDSIAPSRPESEYENGIMESNQDTVWKNEEPMLPEAALLLPGSEIILSPTETATVLTAEQAAQLLDFGQLRGAATGEPLAWLIQEDSHYRLTDSETGIALYPYSETLYIISNGEDYGVAAIRS